MEKVTLADLDLIDAWSETDERRGAHFNFPIFSSTGARASAVVYFEVVPAMVPHDVLCAGDQPVKVVGWFASATVVSVFDEPFAPIGRRVLGTPLPEEPAAASA